VTVKCIAYALAAALLAESTHAYDAIPDDVGTYYEPGTYFPQLDKLDALKLSWRPMLPPAEYDHPFQGRLRVIEAGSMDKVWRVCFGALPPYVQRHDLILACAIPSTLVQLDPEADCVVLHALEGEIRSLGSTLNITMRHELGHCNGWKTHEGIRGAPPFETVKEYPYWDFEPHTRTRIRPEGAR
jgi:hypothetical protein